MTVTKVAVESVGQDTEGNAPATRTNSKSSATPINPCSTIPSPQSSQSETVQHTPISNHIPSTPMSSSASGSASSSPGGDMGLGMGIMIDSPGDEVDVNPKPVSVHVSVDGTHTPREQMLASTQIDRSEVHSNSSTVENPVGELGKPCTLVFDLRYVSLFPGKINAIHRTTRGTGTDHANGYGYDSGNGLNENLAVHVNGSVSTINYGMNTPNTCDTPNTIPVPIHVVGVELDCLSVACSPDIVSDVVFDVKLDSESNSMEVSVDSDKHEAGPVPVTIPATDSTPVSATASATLSRESSSGSKTNTNINTNTNSNTNTGSIEDCTPHEIDVDDTLNISNSNGNNISSTIGDGSVQVAVPLTANMESIQ